MANIEIIRFRAWLAVGGEPDGTEEDATVFPITSAAITASLNSIPVATVTMQTSLYSQLAQKGVKPTFEDHQRIAREALIAGGGAPKDAL